MMSYHGTYYRASPYGITLPPNPTHEVVTAPSGASAYAVTVSDLKEFLSYPAEDAAIDAEITAYLLAAQRAIEQYCELTLLSTTYRMDVSHLDEQTVLQKRPFSALTDIKYVSADDGSESTIAATNYLTASYAQLRGAVYLGRGKAWPEAAERPDAFRITYVAGWADADSVPDDITHAIKMTVAMYEANRGDCSGGESAASVFAMQNAQRAPVPAPAIELLAPYKLREIISL